MPANLYLIAHKVRGEPAFDVAEQMQCPLCPVEPEAHCDECDGLGYWWIIPTSGHRAYPYAHWRLEDLFDGSDYPHQRPWTFDDKMPQSLPDHYACNDRNPQEPAQAIPSLTALGLLKPIKRRLLNAKEPE